MRQVEMVFSSWHQDLLVPLQVVSHIHQTSRYTQSFWCGLLALVSYLKATLNLLPFPRAQLASSCSVVPAHKELPLHTHMPSPSPQLPHPTQQTPAISRSFSCGLALNTFLFPTSPPSFSKLWKAVTCLLSCYSFLSLQDCLRLYIISFS